MIPALNEAGRLPATLASLDAFLAASPSWTPAELVVVDDGSDDGTSDAVASVALSPGVAAVVVRHPRNRGKGAAVRTGFDAARGQSVLLCDADEATPVAELERLGREADERCVVIGSRALDRSRIVVRQPLPRDLLGRTFNLLVRVAGLAREHDTQCGFKLFPGDLARALATVQRLDGFAYDVELLALARAWGFGVREVPVAWRHVAGSRITPLRHGAQMLRDVLRLWWWKTRGRLPRPPGSLLARRRGPEATAG